jgi:hypothetical protein
MKNSVYGAKEKNPDRLKILNCRDSLYYGGKARETRYLAAPVLVLSLS